MAVEGIEIEIGQVWQCCNGAIADVRGHIPNTTFCWKTSLGCCTTEGKFSGFDAHRSDFAKLVEPARFEGTFDELVPPQAILPEQRSNPKDAIGDKKLPLHLLSPIAEAHWAIGQYAGLLKYGAWNWRVAGVRSSVYISAARRHLAAYLSGEEFDPTDGSHHLGNVMACCAILLEARELGKLTDDRPPSYGIRSTYKWAEDQMVTLKVQYADMSPRHYTIADSEVPK